MANKNFNEVSALRLEKIVKDYGQGETKVHALKGVSLNFRKSEFVSILGPSGCGKTTMLNIIGGLDRYTSGDLYINGISTKEYKDGDWDTYRNNSIGFIFQSYNLIPHQNVLSNVELALTLSGVSNKERKKRAKKALEKVGLKGMEHKLPNQMSGGQMQRVAIARALVNDPEIILADEPTGALDTETSVQIMELLKEVAKDRLVIMVTHNPELAEKYSTRTIRLLDGEVVGDSNPFDGNSVVEKKTKKGKAHMKLTTAFSLSLSNLRTKKGRTALTSVAGSIGIIGIALVLALSTGFSQYVNKLQADTLSVYPITVSEATIDISDFNKLMDQTGLEKFPTVKKVTTKQMFGNLTNMLKSNKLSEDYLAYVDDFVNKENEKAKKTADGWKYSVTKGYGFDVNNYLFSEIGFMPSAFDNKNFTMPIDQIVRYLEGMFNNGMQNSNMNVSAEFVREYIPTVSEMPDVSLLKSQYDLLEGEWAEEEDELMLVVSSTNQITDITLALLGFRSIESMNVDTYTITFGGSEEYTFDQLLNKEFYYLKNDSRYQKIGDDYIDPTYLDGKKLMDESAFSPDMTLKIKGILRIKEGVEQGVLDTGIAYTKAFKERILSDNLNSQIVNDAKSSLENSVKVRSWYEFGLGSDPVAQNMVMSSSFTARELAGVSTVNKLSLYSLDFDAKENLKTYLDAWNTVKGRFEEDEVHYSDSTAMLFSALNMIVDSVKIVLIAFTAISLVVSSIMIGIITYVSVVERTKEIGVLRSLGARKKDISRIFNAETFIIGLFAGLIGVAFTYILSIPINLIFASLMSNVGNIAALKVTDATILVVVSFVLTLIAGVIPARIAAKKDPVIALRSE